MGLLGLPDMSEEHFEMFEGRIEERLGFIMNDPQRQIMRAIAGLNPDGAGYDVIMVQAAPGAGKTTLIVMTTMLIDMMYELEYINEYPSVLALSHMRQNRAMLERYLPHWVNKFTVHKFGRDLLSQHMGYIDTKQFKVYNTTLRVLKNRYPMGVKLLDEDGELTTRLVDEIYPAITQWINILIVSLVDPENVFGIEYMFDYEPPSVSGMTDQFREKLITDIAPTVMKYIEASRIESGYVSFEEMVATPVKNRWIDELYDIVLIDEGQDLSTVQQIIAQRTAPYIFIVGDKNQSMLKFAGADVDSWGRMAYILNPYITTMPISQRCSRNVIKYLQALFKEVIPRKDAVDGEVGTLIDVAELHKKANNPNTGVVCRTHSDVADAYVSLMYADINPPIVVLGNDVFGAVESCVRGLKKINLPSKLTKNTFFVYLNAWLEVELQKTESIKMQAQRDVRRKEVLSVFKTMKILHGYFDPETPDELVDLVGERFGKTSDDVVRKQRLFKKSVVIGTAHAWKGLEIDNVIIYRTENFLDDRGKENSQEEEVLFVAMSRAKQNLYFYPKAIVTPVDKIDMDVTYEPVVNNTLPYPGFDTTLFKGDVQLIAGDWVNNMEMWYDALKGK